MKQDKKHTHRKQRAISPKSGQAIIEFCVGLICIMAIMVTLLQIASITRVRTDLMARARIEAGESSLSDFSTLSGANFIEDWDAGNDNIRYSADDSPNNGSAMGIHSSILDYSVEEPDDWQILNDMPATPLMELNSYVNPVSMFGLVLAERSGSVTNNAAFRNLIYDSETIDFDVQVWMTWTRGIY